MNPIPTSVYLFSSGSLARFPNNTLVDFNNYLAEEIETGENWEIGIASIGFEGNFAFESDVHKKTKDSFADIYFVNTDLEISSLGQENLPKPKSLDNEAVYVLWTPEQMPLGIKISDLDSPFNAITFQEQAEQLLYWQKLQRTFSIRAVSEREVQISNATGGYFLIRSSYLDSHLTIEDGHLEQYSAFKKPVRAIRNNIIYRIYKFNPDPLLDRTKLTIKFNITETEKEPQILSCRLDIVDNGISSNAFDPTTALVFAPHKLIPTAAVDVIEEHASNHQGPAEGPASALLRSRRHRPNKSGGRYTLYEPRVVVFHKIRSNRIRHIRTTISALNSNRVLYRRGILTFLRLIIRPPAMFGVHYHNLLSNIYIDFRNKFGPYKETNKFAHSVIYLDKPLKFDLENNRYQMALVSMTAKFNYTTVQNDIRISYSIKSSDQPEKRFNTVLGKGLHFKSPEEFVMHLNRPLKLMFVFKYLEYKQNKGNIVLHTKRNAKVTIYASEEFFRMSGLSPYAVTNVTQEGPSKVLHLNRNEVFESHTPIDLKILRPRLLFLYCSIVKKVIGPENNLRLLRIIDLPDYCDVYQTLHVQNLTYAEIALSEVQQIEFTALMEDGSEISMNTDDEIYFNVNIGTLPKRQDELL